MGRKKQEPVSLTVDQVAIRVYPFGQPDPVPGWISLDWIDTASGPPARGVRIEIGPPMPGQDGLDAWSAAIRCARRLKYRNVWVQSGIGTLEHMNP